MFETIFLIGFIIIFVLVIGLVALIKSEYVYNKNKYLTKLELYETFVQLVDEQFPDEIIIQTEIKKLTKRLGSGQSN